MSIAWLKEASVADIDLESKDVFMPILNLQQEKLLRLIGGGPKRPFFAAYFLAAAGHDVTIYEAMPKLGGILRYGIPQYRLPKEVLDEEIALIEKLGVKMITNTKIGRMFPLAISAILRRSFSYNRCMDEVQNSIAPRRSGGALGSAESIFKTSIHESAYTDRKAHCNRGRRQYSNGRMPNGNSTRYRKSIQYLPPNKS